MESAKFDDFFQSVIASLDFLSPFVHMKHCHKKNKVFS